MEKMPLRPERLFSLTLQKADGSFWQQSSPIPLIVRSGCGADHQSTEVWLAASSSSQDDPNSFLLPSALSWHGRRMIAELRNRNLQIHGDLVTLWTVACHLIFGAALDDSDGALFGAEATPLHSSRSQRLSVAESKAINREARVASGDCLLPMVALTDEAAVAEVSFRGRVEASFSPSTTDGISTSLQRGTVPATDGIARAISAKEQGNELFQKGAFSEALQRYWEAVEIAGAVLTSDVGAEHGLMETSARLDRAQRVPLLETLTLAVSNAAQCVLSSSSSSGTQLPADTAKRSVRHCDRCVALLTTDRDGPKVAKNHRWKLMLRKAKLLRRLGDDAAARRALQDLCSLLDSCPVEGDEKQRATLLEFRNAVKVELQGLATA